MKEVVKEDTNKSLEEVQENTGNRLEVKKKQLKETIKTVQDLKMEIKERYNEGIWELKKI